VAGNSRHHNRLDGHHLAWGTTARRPGVIPSTERRPASLRQRFRWRVQFRRWRSGMATPSHLVHVFWISRPVYLANNRAMTCLPCIHRLGRIAKRPNNKLFQAGIPKTGYLMSVKELHSIWITSCKDALMRASPALPMT